MVIVYSYSNINLSEIPRIFLFNILIAASAKRSLTILVNKSLSGRSVGVKIFVASFWKGLGIDTDMKK